MPSIVGNMVVQNSNGSFNLGDFYNVSPKENTKSYNGSGSSNVAFVANTFSSVSATNTFDADVADQNQVGTA
ncbi:MULTISPECIES: spore germination protein [Bacillus cereus group]|uniref:spore germination protein n=1 Tax=Bacillus cereus group TaxID=86661 RepID=UPI0001A02576|nr:MULTISPECIES: spore germination protein [Bacillus cereus group]EEK70373.1 spore germination protein gerPF [Bacillus mycoides]OOR17211.1 spore germination protein [Bacillus mycoides]QWG81640.1 spore germination protein [Bacillus mycoides]TXR75259.1 spore germination protein [Bacillus sp. AR13-1]